MQSRGRAYLIGNGYSLTAGTLDSLKSEVTFAMNGIAGMFPLTEWRPTYYVMVTTRCMNDVDFRLKAQEAVIAAKTSFVDSSYKGKNYFSGDADVCYIETHELLEWSNNYSMVSKYATSMLSAMQIAAALGYGPLYLYGVDGYREANNHCFGDYFDGFIDVAEDNKNMRAAYEFAKAHCPVQIYDLTESEGFGVFERLRD